MAVSVFEELTLATPAKNLLAKVGSQEIPGITGKFGLGVQNCHASVYSSVFVSSQQRFGVMDTKAPSACNSSWVLDRPYYSS